LTCNAFTYNRKYFIKNNKNNKCHKIRFPLKNCPTIAWFASQRQTTKTTTQTLGKTWSQIQSIFFEETALKNGK